MSLSEQLTEYIRQTEYDDLPEDVIEYTKLCILDYFGSAVAGKEYEPIKKIDKLVKELGGKEQASFITGGASSVLNVSLLNGSASHMVEQDDIHKGSVIHAATVVIPAALSIAEWKNLSGQDLITAVVVGYEVCFRIGEAVTPSHYYYFHNTATCGTFGAAAAAAKLLNLDKEQIIHSLGSAGTQAAGLWEFIEDGAMSKQLHPGKAAMNGVLSALLAEKNFTGASQILEGKRGFFEALSEEYDVSKVTNQLGEAFKILENSFKKHASCRHTHHAMDMMIDLVEEENISYKNIKRIEVKTYKTAIDITDNQQPTTVYQAKFSLQYCTALAAVRNKGDIYTFNKQNLWDENIREVMDKVELSVEEEINNEYPEKWGAVIEVYTLDGKKAAKTSKAPKGDPENRLTKQELHEKFLTLTQGLGDKNKKMAKFIFDLENQSNLKKLFPSNM